MRMRSQETADSPQVHFSVAAHQVLAADVEKLNQWRKQPGSNISTSSLRQSDEQTIAALKAIGEAIADSPLQDQSLTDWGVIAAPRFLGRVMMGQVLPKFRQEGAWGVSPHLIPHRSLHSMSGTLSQVLGMRGPNFGVGGGITAAAEAMFLASSLLTDQLPGLWVVMTGYHPERMPDHEDQPSQCLAVALALQPAWGRIAGPRLSLTIGNNFLRYPLFTLEEVFLALQGNWLGQKFWRLPYGGTLQLECWQEQQRGAA